MLESFRPAIRARSIEDIDLVALREEGFEALLLDLDNTLLPWKNSQLPDSSAEWVRAAKKCGMKVCIVSNTHYPKRLNSIAEALDIPAISHALKPRSSGFDRAVEMLNCEMRRSVVVGDQLLTDILGGNRVGARTVLVDPMHPHEFLGTKISRLVERLIFAALGMQARVGTKSQRTKSDQKDTK